MQDEEIAVGDIGGTHARFAMARIADGRVRALGPAHVLQVADHPGLAEAWRAFLAETRQRAASRGLPGGRRPVRGDVLKFTNSPWRLGAPARERNRRRTPDARSMISAPSAMRSRNSLPIISSMSAGPRAAFSATRRRQHPRPWHRARRRLDPAGCGRPSRGRDRRRPFRLCAARFVRGRVAGSACGRNLAGSRSSAWFRAPASRESAPPSSASRQPPPGLTTRRSVEGALSGADLSRSAALERFCSCFGGFAGDVGAYPWRQRRRAGGRPVATHRPLLPQSGFAQD